MCWAQQLMDLLGCHINSLKIYEQFNQNFVKFEQYVNDLEFTLDKWIEKNELLSDESIFNQIKTLKSNLDESRHLDLDKLNELFELARKMPAYKMRTKTIKHPYNKCQILTQYKMANFIVFEGENCVIEDNTNRIKWKVHLKDRNAYAEIPSVCFMLPNPDPDLVEMVQK